MAYIRRFWALPWWVKGPVMAIVILMVIGLLAPSDDAPDEAAAADPTPTVTRTATALRCFGVHPVVMSGIAEGLTINGNGAIAQAWAVRSTDHENIWFVAADLIGPGLEGDDDIAVWAVSYDPSGTEITGLTTSADAMAAEFSDWPRVETVTGTEEAARAARECAKER